MPTLIGTDTISSISRQVVFDFITDQVYGSNALFYRWNRAGKKHYEGGRHFEAPFITAINNNVQSYDGFDMLDTNPFDTVKNGGWDTKKYNAPVSISGTAIMEANSSQAIANIVKLQWKQAIMGMENRLGTDFWGTATLDSTKIDGCQDIIDDGTTATSYAALTRASNTYLNANINSATSTLTIAAIQNMMGTMQRGGHGCSLIVSRQEQYNRVHALGVTNQRFNAAIGGTDQQLLSAGFTNVLVNNVPWLIDDKVFDGPNSSNSAIVFFNEEVFQIAIMKNTDFRMVDFQQPHNQDAMVGHLRWYGNVICTAPQMQGKMTNISS